MGTLDLLMITFQRDGTWVLEKDTLGYNTDKRVGEDLDLKGAEKKCVTEGFPK